MSKIKMTTVITVGLALVAGQLGFASAAQAAPGDANASVACATATLDLPTAITAANNNLGADTITITGDCGAGSAILLTSSLPDITDELTIDGAGATLTVIQRGFDNRALHAASASPAHDDRFVAGGVLYTPTDVQALFKTTGEANLTLSNLKLDGNGDNFLGRLVEMGSGNLTISGAELSGSNASKICTEAVLLPTSGGDDEFPPYTSECVIPYEDKDESTDPYSYTPTTSGGAIVSGPGVTTIHHSTIADNRSSLDGGAISVTGPLNMWNNTLFNNESLSGVGGAVSISGVHSAESQLINNTFKENLASGGVGSAISATNDVLVRVVGSLFVNDSCNISTASEAVREYNVTAGSTVAGSVPATTCGTNAAVEVDTNKNVEVASLNLAPSATINSSHPDNSGHVRTIALNEGSSAIDTFTAGDLSTGTADATFFNSRIADDARGVSRSHVRAGLKIDAGAYEFVSDVIPLAVVSTTDGSTASAGGTSTLGGTVETSGLAPSELGFYYSKTNPVDCNTVTRTPGNSVQATTPSLGDPQFTDGVFTPVSFSAGISGLSASTTYYYCAYAITAASANAIYGEVRSFGTLALALDLNLNLGATNVLAGASTTASGSGLQPYSEANLYQYSERKKVATFSVDQFGNFSGSFVITNCDVAGDHKFRIEGTAPDGTPVSEEVYYILDPNCVVQANAEVRLQNATLTVDPVLFPNRSAKLSAKYKKMLRAWVPLLKGAGTITINGYTETKQRTKAAIKACEKLSVRRAAAVKKYLKSQGVDVNFILIGHGATKPASSNQPKNRRATIEFPMVYGIK